MKSETINLFQAEETAQFEEEPGIAGGRVLPDVPALVPRLRLQPNRRVTLSELMNALGEAIKVNERRESIVRQKAEPSIS